MPAHGWSESTTLSIVWNSAVDDDCASIRSYENIISSCCDFFVIYCVRMSHVWPFHNSECVQMWQLLFSRTIEIWNKQRTLPLKKIICFKCSFCQFFPPIWCAGVRAIRWDVSEYLQIHSEIVQRWTIEIINYYKLCFVKQQFRNRSETKLNWTNTKETQIELVVELQFACQSNNFELYSVCKFNVFVQPNKNMYKVEMLSFIDELNLN